MTFLIPDTFLPRRLPLLSTSTRTMAGTIAAIHRCEESLPIRGIRACPARARWGQNDRGVARPEEHFFGGAPDGNCPGKYSTVRCHTTGHSVDDRF